MLSSMLTIMFLVWAIATSSFAMVQPSQGRSGGNRTLEPNLHVPNLYADKVDLIAVLVDLPGSKKAQSHWELSYQLFFVPEAEYYKTIQSLPQGGSNPGPEQFSGRILLGEGREKKTGLESLKERTISLTGVTFKQKVPDAQRTKFAYLMTAYSVKIFDAELNKTVYHSGIFLTEPYETDRKDEKQDIARKSYYLSFRVTPTGTLNRSQLRPKILDTISQ